MNSPQPEPVSAARSDVSGGSAPWYAGVSGYQWLVLLIASAGWVFDAFEGQIFNLTRDQMLHDILKDGATQSAIKNYGDQFLAVFLAGGTVGGLLFGTLGDRCGRRPAMAVTILMYSVFSGLTYFATSLWQVAALRFLVAMGVGGEWAVAASLVAEVFPRHARAHASGIFHATSILGIWIAALAGMAVAAHWRYAYLIGIVPALLILWVRTTIREPESWRAAGQRAASEHGPPMGSFRDLLLNPRWKKRAILGMLLAAVGLGSFWAVAVAGQDLAKEMLIRQGVAREIAIEKAKFAYGIVETSGALLGLLSFGPLCVRLGRKRTFILLHLGAFIIVPITCYLPQSYTQLLILLPVFGFLMFANHAGYAVYFPELFPAHLRATGTGFCFNGGRIVSAVMLLVSGWLKQIPNMDLRLAISILGCLFLFGIIIVVFLPETKGQPLPE